MNKVKLMIILKMHLDKMLLHKREIFIIINLYNLFYKENIKICNRMLKNLDLKLLNWTRFFNSRCFVFILILMKGTIVYG